MSSQDPYASGVYKERAKAAAPSHGRCLVENSPVLRDFQYCYALSRTKKDDETFISSLEWYWKRRKGTLNLDTRYNIFPAGLMMRLMYDNGQWILAPEDYIVQMYHRTLIVDINTSTRTNYPDLPNGRYNYRLIPIKNMENISLTRQKDSTNTATINAIQVYMYPFNTLPPLLSHIHPKFAIANAGEKLQSLPKYDRDILLEEYPILGEILSIYIFWTSPIAMNAEDDPSYYPPHPNVIDSDWTGEEEIETASISTVVGRTGTRRKPRKRSGSTTAGTLTEKAAGSIPNEGNPNTQKPPKRISMKRKHPSFLSEKTVGEHNKKVGKTGWDTLSMTEWSQNIESTSESSCSGLRLEKN